MNRWKTIGLFSMALGLLWNCSSTKSAEATAVKNRQFEELKELVTTKSFTIDIKTAHPMLTYDVMQITNALLRNTGNTAGRIDVTGNFIKVIGDSVEAGLSYYGEVRIANSLDPRDAGINFKGEPRSYEVSENEKKQTLSVEFNIKGKTMELFSVNMQLYPNKNATIFVNSPNRNSIRYDGTLRMLEENVSTK